MSKGQTPTSHNPSFSFGTYGGPSDDEPVPKFSWRLPKDESLSDWTVRVMDLDTGLSQEYHVHKAKLAVGERRSDFFKTQFENLERFKTNCTKLKFNSQAAGAFEVLLDFMYADEKDIDVSTETACALFYLSDYLACKAAYGLVGAFIEKDLKGNCVLYFRDSSIYAGQDKLADQALVEVSGGGGIGWGEDPECAIFGTLSSEQMIAICSHDMFKDAMGSSTNLDCIHHHKGSQWSWAVSAFCRANPDEVDADFFATVIQKGAEIDSDWINPKSWLLFLSILDRLDDQRPSAPKKKKRKGEAGIEADFGELREKFYRDFVVYFEHVINHDMTVIFTEEEQAKYIEEKDDGVRERLKDIKNLRDGRELKDSTVIELLQRLYSNRKVVSRYRSG